MGAASRAGGVDLGAAAFAATLGAATFRVATFRVATFVVVATFLLAVFWAGAFAAAFFFVALAAFFLPVAPARPAVFLRAAITLPTNPCSSNPTKKWRCLYNPSASRGKILKYTPVDDVLHEYQVAHRTLDDAILDALRDRTAERFGGAAAMQISREQGTFLGLLVAAIGATTALEIGTFTGYSALCIARALPADGRLLCCDVSEEFTGLAREAWAKAGVAERIDLRIGPAIETLRALSTDECFDFVFIDADKPGYVDYYEGVLPRLRPNGLIALDNVFWGGNVVSGDDENAAALRKVNDHVAADRRVQSVMLAVSDGLTLVRKL